MPSTKIINVLRDDKFEEILDVFKNTSAKEVIFILPKKTNALKDESHFIILQNEAKKFEKTVSLLCSNPEINDLAKQYDFDILMPKAGNLQNSPPVKNVQFVNQIEPTNDDDGIGNEDNEPFDLEEKEENTKEENGDSVGQNKPLSDEPDDNDDDSDTPDKDEADESDEFAQPFKNTNTEKVENSFEIIAAAAPSKTNRNLSDIINPEQNGVNLKITQKKQKPVSLDIKSRDQAEEKADRITGVWQFASRRQDKEFNRSGGGYFSNFNLPKNLRFKNILKNVSGGRKIFWFLGALATIFLLAFVSVLPGSAKIEISPQKQKLDFRLKITASAQFPAVDFAFNKIPGQLFNIRKNANRTFNATGEREVAQKARGKITVYNEYGTTPQTLIATTRFESPEGLIFRTLKTIVVPGTKVENGKIIPGGIEVEVIADKAGPLYNIAPSKFTIPAFKERNDQDRYGKFYGQSTEPIKGGASGMAKVVTEADYDDALAILTAEAKKLTEEALANEASDLKIINAAAVKVDGSESSAKSDEAAENFTMTVSASVKTVGFRQDDLNKLIKQYAEKNGDIIVLPEKLTVSFDKVSLSGLDVLEFTARVGGDAYLKVNEQKIITDLLGKNENQIKDYFKNLPEIRGAKVLLSPFWVKKMSKNQDKIKLNLVYD